MHSFSKHLSALLCEWVSFHAYCVGLPEQLTCMFISQTRVRRHECVNCNTTPDHPNPKPGVFHEVAFCFKHLTSNCHTLLVRKCIAFQMMTPFRLRVDLPESGRDWTTSWIFKDCWAIRLPALSISFWMYNATYFCSDSDTKFNQMRPYWCWGFINVKNGSQIYSLIVSLCT